MILVAGYIATMGASGLAARAVVKRTLTDSGLETPTRLMVAPAAANPFRKWVVMEVGDIYRCGTFDWLGSPRITLETFTYERHPASFAAAAATRGPRVRRFLSWARFPFSLVDADEGFYRVELGDARYTLDPVNSWAGIVVEVGR